MTLIQLTAIFLALITLIGWINARFFRLPPSVAILGSGLLAAIILHVAQTEIEPFWGFNHVRDVVKTLDFTDTVLDYLLGFLLFAGGMQADLGELRRRRAAVWSLATFGVLISTALVGLGTHAAAKALGIPLPLPWAFAFGALISPTDPVAVIGAMRSGAVSTRLGAVLQGEALFNDGVGFVAFSAALTFLTTGDAPHPLHDAGSVVLEAGGGLLLGAACAHATVLALRVIDDRAVETTATVALAVGVYVLAGPLHLSGPIAAATAGLVIGESGLKTAMSNGTRRVVEGFWDVVDQILNALLFLLLALQVFVLPFRFGEIGLWLCASAMAALARLIVILPWGAWFAFHQKERGASMILTWGGLRGAVSLALALSLPHGPFRDTVLGMTFTAVAISVLVQGLTFPALAGRLGRRRDSAAVPR